MIKSVLIFGGTFDPVHNGHLHCLQSAKALVCPDISLVVPCAVPPHKAEAFTNGKLRAQMCRALSEREDNTIVYTKELERSGKSFTIDTIHELRREYKDAKLYLCIGGDMLLYFRKWYKWQEIIQNVVLVVQAREDNMPTVREEAQSLAVEGANILFTLARPLCVSSTQLREAVCRGEDVSHLVPQEVNAIIMQNNLYQGYST